MNIIIFNTIHILIMAISTSSEHAAIIRRIRKLDAGHLYFLPFVEKRLTISSIHMPNNSPIVSTKSSIGKVNRKMSPTLKFIVEKPRKTSAKLVTYDENLMPSNQENKSSQITYLNDKQNPIPVIKPNFKYQSSSTMDSYLRNWNVSSGPMNINLSNQADIKDEFVSLAEENMDIKNPSAIDNETFVGREEPKFNLKENSNKFFINSSSVVDREEFILQKERKIVFLEEKLKSQGENENSSLLFAISLLHQHINGTTIPTGDYTSKAITDPPDISNENRLKINRNPKKTKVNLIHKHQSISSTEFIPLMKSIKKNPENNNAVQIPAPTNHENPLYRSFILVLDGKCMEVRNRMNTFVKYLKGTLATKLNTEYNDIKVPSVVCDTSFVVNVSFDSHKYPEAYTQLRNLAASNATLLEISGHIFYLEKVLTNLPSIHFNLREYFGGEYQLHAIAFISAVCMCVFLTIAVTTFYILKCYYCRDPVHISSKEEAFISDEKIPNIIYSANFSKLLNSRSSPNPQGRRRESCEINSDGKSDLSSEIYPVSFSNANFDSFNSVIEKNQNISKSSSQLRLMEEIQEDEEYLDELRFSERGEC